VVQEVALIPPLALLLVEEAVEAATSVVVAVALTLKLQALTAVVAVVDLASPMPLDSSLLFTQLLGSLLMVQPALPITSVQVLPLSLPLHLLAN
jgi:hypothetical protein